ncbi:MAG: pyridoxal phosphate-dependent aminotransferase [Legionellaceae bacterium]|nr:pyridoxal phosphate-dependent aminotransferase [Legionellaceae bacterium]
MLTPNGQLANKIEKVMLLSLWTHTLIDEIASQNKSNTKKVISAGLGKPTYPINEQTVASYLAYWQRIDNLRKKWHLSPEEIQESTAVDYGDPRGDSAPRALMAEIMSKWYLAEIKPEHVLFTVGGIGALRVIFETFNTHYEEIPGYRIITPFPYYSAYSNNPSHRLHPINVMKSPGYKLTSEALEESIKEAYTLAETDHGLPKAVLICNPSNPLGNIVEEEELKKIADVLRGYPDLYIIFDEAYVEMCYVEMPSFLKIAPDLKHRVIILRSATKALSAAGERMAILLVFEPTLMNEMLNKNISYFIHAPRSAQLAYAETMANFDETERNKLVLFYKKKVEYVIKRLHMMGAAMPDPLYNVEATFYALADLSDLFGLELPCEMQRVFKNVISAKIETGEELVYYLLFKDLVMVSPLSYFGLPTDSGFVRITCSGNEQELQELMDRLEQRLFKARKSKQLTLLENIKIKLPDLKNVDFHMHEIIFKKIDHIIHQEDTCLMLKKKNKVLDTLQATIINFLDFMH